MAEIGHRDERGFRPLANPNKSVELSTTCATSLLSGTYGLSRRDQACPQNSLVRSLSQLEERKPTQEYVARSLENVLGPRTDVIDIPVFIMGNRG